MKLKRGNIVCISMLDGSDFIINNTKRIKSFDNVVEVECGKGSLLRIALADLKRLELFRMSASCCNIDIRTNNDSEQAQFYSNEVMYFSIETDNVVMLYCKDENYPDLGYDPDFAYNFDLSDGSCSMQIDF